MVQDKERSLGEEILNFIKLVACYKVKRARGQFLLVMYAIHSVKIFHCFWVQLFLPQEAHIKINFLILTVEEKDNHTFIACEET